MLDIRHNRSVYFKRFISVVALMPACLAYSSSAQDATAEINYLVAYFNKLSDKDTFDEAIEYLLDFRESIIKKGYQVPLLSTLTLYYWDAIQSQGIVLDEDIIIEIYWKFLASESNIDDPKILERLQQKCTLKHHHKKKGKSEVKITGKMAVGFLKFAAGCLCCVVPFPAVEAVGACLAANGINDMLDAAKENDEENEHLVKAHK